MGRVAMLTLGIDTSGRTAGAALLGDGRVLGSLSATGPHSAVLLPMVRDLLAAHCSEPGALEVVGVARGPGSYTGLRVGVVTAKALGRATGAKVLGVPTLDVVASLAPETARRVLVVLRAYKRRVLVASFRRGGRGNLEVEGEPALVQAAELPSREGAEVVVTDAEDLIDADDLAPQRVDVLGPVADAVARFAEARAAAGAGDEAYLLAPDYLRPPSITVGKGHRP